MKRILLACSLVTTICASAENISKTVNNTSANSLKQQLPMAEWGTINDLTITGPLGNADITFLSNVAKAANNLQNLDMSGASELLEIPKDAFNGIKSLTSVSMPSSLNTIAEKAFMDCTNLTKVTFNEGLTTISDRAFTNDSLLTTITFPASLGDLNITALDGCNNLEEIRVNPGSQVYSSIQGVLYTMEDLTLIKYPVARQEENFIIPDGTTNIGNNAFINCKLIKTIEMPASVKKIGKSAFSNCEGFRFIIVGDGVTDIADFAFAGCTNLESISFPRTLKTIGDAFLAKCCNITSIRCEAFNPPTFSSLIESPFVSQDVTVCSLNLATCVLSVPTKAQSKYENARGWDTFANVEGFILGK